MNLYRPGYYWEIESYDTISQMLVLLYSLDSLSLVNLPIGDATQPIEEMLLDVYRDILLDVIKLHISAGVLQDRNYMLVDIIDDLYVYEVQLSNGYVDLSAVIDPSVVNRFFVPKLRVVYLPESSSLRNIPRELPIERVTDMPVVKEIHALPFPPLGTPTSLLLYKERVGISIEVHPLLLFCVLEQSDLNLLYYYNNPIYCAVTQSYAPIDFGRSMLYKLFHPGNYRPIISYFRLDGETGRYVAYGDDAQGVLDVMRSRFDFKSYMYCGHNYGAGRLVERVAQWLRGYDTTYIYSGLVDGEYIVSLHEHTYNEPVSAYIKVGGILPPTSAGTGLNISAILMAIAHLLTEDSE